MAEGNGVSDMYRNTSEELFLKSLMENSVGMPVPTMEMLGFKNISSHLHHHHHNHNRRIDSEELFKSWLTNGENNDCNPSSITHRTRQASRRISTELPNLTGQQPGSTLEKKKSNDVLFTQNDYTTVDTISADLNQQLITNVVEQHVQASNLYLAKAWFNSSQPMTRSRSSELRKRYAVMQSAQTFIGNDISNLKQESAHQMHDIGNQLGTFMSPSNSSSSTFNAAPQMGDVDRISSVVSMLKGTLERKKLGNQMQKEPAEDSCNAIYHGHAVPMNSSFDQEKGNSIPEIPPTFQDISSSYVNEGGVFQTVEENVDIDLEGFVNPVIQIHQLNTISREPSQSESSAAAPMVSSGFDACDGPSNSSQTLSICESSRKQVENNKSSENGPRAKDFRERIIENLKDDRKRGGLVRYGSVTSTGSVDEGGDTTKKRRVERSRKMAEAKERSSTPAIPSDMQSVLKRCENLEKEVRSLKLNLSFMNRKDSEQTKQIEELQKKNEDMAEEKERLLEEIERILSETGKM